MIPAGSTASLRPRSAASSAPGSRVADAPWRSARSCADNLEPPASTTYARVKQGDTLFSIARQFDTTVETLNHLNQLSTDVIVVGDKLTVRR